MAVKKDPISIYGGTGILGSYYRQLFPTLLVPREQLAPCSSEVLYLISTTDNYTYKEDPLVDIETNLVALMKRLDLCRAYGIKTFNFVSSHFVYDPSHVRPDETASCEPNGFYSITKRTAEKLVMEYCNTFGIDWRILRVGNVYGGPDSGSTKRNALHFLINKVRKNEPVQIHRQISRDFMHIFDVCGAIHTVCEHGHWNEIYNIGTGIETPLADCVQKAKEYLGSKSSIHLVDAPVDYPQALRFSLDCSKLNFLGFTPSISLEEGLQDLCSSQRLCTPDRTLTDKKLKQQLKR
jgi:nucleoside-diphosphate-sugar epimerase